jgi:hypothetical protein
MQMISATPDAVKLAPVRRRGQARRDGKPGSARPTLMIGYTTFGLWLLAAPTAG